MQDPDAAVAARGRVAAEDLLAAAQLAAELFSGRVSLFVEILDDACLFNLVRIFMLTDVFFFRLFQIYYFECVRRLQRIQLVVENGVCHCE